VEKPKKRVTFADDIDITVREESTEVKKPTVEVTQLMAM